MRGFEVWETLDPFTCMVLPSVEMISQVLLARKWVHGIRLLSDGQVTERTTQCLMDKKDGGKGKKVGKSGHRRFASRTGRDYEMTDGGG